MNHLTWLRKEANIFLLVKLKNMLQKSKKLKNKQNQNNTATGRKKVSTK